jgi:hypothetical protein
VADRVVEVRDGDVRKVARDMAPVDAREAAPA